MTENNQDRGAFVIEERKRTMRLIMGLAVMAVVLQSLIYFELMNLNWQLVIDQALITLIGALGLSIIYGFTGQFSLGHAAFYGIGAYTAGVIGKLHGVFDLGYFALALLAGTVAAGLVALIVGIPVLRLKSDYLGIATLGFGFIVVKGAMENGDKLLAEFGGATGMTGVPQIPHQFAFIMLFILAILAIILVRNFIDSSFGRVCVTIREDEIAADAMGINPFKYKVLAFVLGCAIAGFAGGLYAYRFPLVHPSTFDFMPSINFLLIVVLGGLGSLSGTVITAIVWIFLLATLRQFPQVVEYQGVIYALILILLIQIRPQGIFGGKEWNYLFPAVDRKERSEA
ncbi:MAG: branched-chain amino acid ABC transporter permease [Solirubrobacterales bacterium]